MAHCVTFYCWSLLTKQTTPARLVSSWLRRTLPQFLVQKMADPNITMSVWFPVAVAVGSTSVLAGYFLLCTLCLCCCYCSWCVCCPFNRKRGKAQLVTRKRGQSHTRERLQMSSGVTMFVRSRLQDQTSSSALTPLTPITPSSASSSSADSHIHIFPASCQSTLQSDCPSPTDSCSYVLPNNMFEVNDGSERSTSWQKCEERLTSALTWTNLRQLPRSEVEKALKTQGTLGCYMFRKTSDEKVCLSALAESDCALVCRHLILVENTEGKIKIGSLPNDSNSFRCLKDLEEFYWNNEIHFQDGGRSINLTVPCSF